MEPWVQQIAVPLAVAVLTSSGLWALIESVYGETEAK